MRLFYLINEPYLNYQQGYRNALKNLVANNQLEECYFYSFYPKCTEFENNWSLVIKDILNEIAIFRPTAILFSHTTNKVFDSFFFNSVKNLLGYKPIYALDERDVYGRMVKKIPPQLLQLAARCDFIFLVTSGGWMYNVFNKIKKNHLIYLPHVCDDTFFSKTPSETNLKKYDIIMIGNLAKSKIPFKSMPGVIERIQVAKVLYKNYGSRFAVFGNGWDKYPFSAGSISFFNQDEVLRESNLSVGIDHFFSYHQYFSDRLPIALYSGIPHLSYKTPNINLLFEEEKHIFYFDKVEDVNTAATKILSGKIKNLNEIKKEAKDLIEKKYSEKERMKTLIDYLKNHINVIQTSE